MVQAGGGQYLNSVMPSSGVRDADRVASCKNIPEMQAGNEDLMSRCTRGKKVQMDTLLKLSSKKIMTTGVKSKIKRPSTLLAESHSKPEKIAATKLAMEDVVAVKLAAEQSI